MRPFRRQEKRSLKWLTVLLIITSYPLSALAGDRVAVVTGRDEAVTGRLLKELGTAGFDAFSYTGDPEERLEEIARKERAAAVIRLELKGKNVDVWVADRVTNKIVFRSLEVTESSGPTDTIAVLAAVELLRASLMELHAPQKTKGQDAASDQTADFSKPAPVPPVKAARTWQLAGSLGAGLSYLGRRTGVAMSLPLALTLSLRRLLYFRVLGALSLVPSTLEAPEGEVRFSPWLAGGDIGIIALADKSRFQPVLGAGGGAYLIRVRGQADEGFVSRGRLLVGAILFLRGGLRVRFNSRLAMVTDIAAGWTFPGRSIHIAGREVAELGRPLLFAGLSLEVSLIIGS
jgi:hypothetical protein